MSAQAEGDGAARRRELAEAREERWPEVRRRAWAARKLGVAAVATAASQEEGPAPLPMVFAWRGRCCVCLGDGAPPHRTRALSTGTREERGDSYFVLVEKRSGGLLISHRMAKIKACITDVARRSICE